VVAATAVRLLLDPVMENQLVFSLYFAAVAVAAWYGGLRPALLALLLGWLAADWFFLQPRGSLSLIDQDGWPESLTYGLVGLAILACTEGIRRTSRRTVQIATAPSELLAVAEAVHAHQINSRDLVAYLEGLNASPASFMAAAKYEDFDLEPDELAARLRNLAQEERRSPIGSL
jgi:K+-sensing histidine kinase KdpD